jgi:regulator of protease activity HflC (stomatin/prohibitin superfamily)
MSAIIVDEGNVGVVYRLGSLQKETLSPGLHFHLPIATKVYEVKTTLQTDSMRHK